MQDDQDTAVEVTHHSWGDRLLGPLTGALIGLLLIPLSIALLIWNEDRAADRSAALTTAAQVVVSVSPDRVDPAHDGHLIHLSGHAGTGAMVADPDFGIRVPAIRLIRSVEMYQWQESSTSETRDKAGGGSETITTYRYDPTWSSQAIDSAAFHRPDGHENPGTLPVPSTTFAAGRVQLSAFRLSDSLAAAMTDEQPVPLAQAAPDLLRHLGDSPARISGNELYLGHDASRPAIGDLRLRFSMVPAADVSIIARQSGQSLMPYPTPTGPVELLVSGLRGPDGVLQAARSENTLLSWGLRLAGFLLMALGFRLLVSPVEALAFVLPLLGRLTGNILTLLSLLLALILSLITSGTAWLVQHPLTAVIAGGILLALILAVLWGQRKKAASPRGR